MLKTPEFYDYLIVGGGISGLSLAYYLQKSLKPGEKYVLLEASSRLGGKINTVKVKFQNKELTFETGADCVMSGKPAALQLIAELGLSSELVVPSSNSPTLIYQDGRLQKVPDGLMLMLPNKIWPFVKTRLLSLPAKFRILADLFISANSADQDQSVASFIQRRMGSEMLSRIVEPMIGSIFGSNPYKQSMRATFPHLLQMEKDNKSLLLAVLKKRFSKKPVSKQPAFYGFKGGMQGFLSSLAESLSGDCKFNSQVIEIKMNPDKGYEVILADGRNIHAAKIIITSPASETARILSSLSYECSTLLKKIRQLSAVNVNLVYKKDTVKNLPESSGILIPQKPGWLVNAITLSANKFSHYVSDDFIQMRVSLGGYRSPYVNKLSDQQILKSVSDEIRQILKIDSGPEFYLIQRWNKIMPQYDVGHLDLLKKIQQTLPENIFVTGASYAGSSLPDCIAASLKLASRLTECTPAEHVARYI